MARPFEPKPASYHLAALSKMLGQVEVDESLPAQRKTEMRRLIAALMSQFQQELVA